MKRLIVKYEQSSYEYREDNWTHQMEVSNVDELFNFLRECYLMDARNRSNYPMNGYIGGKLEFFEQDYDVCSMGHIHVIESKKVSLPEYYSDSFQKYNQWRARVVRTLTHLRDIAHKKKKEDDEKKKYLELKKKFDNPDLLTN